MKLFVTGSNGQLGRALRAKMPDSMFVNSDELDITDAESVSRLDLSEYDALVNTAAYTAVDAAEEDVEKAQKVNVAGPKLLAAAAKKAGIPIVHISSDYVYSGENDSHSEDEPLKPLSVYGSTKASGDIAVAEENPQHYIMRTSWVVGDGKNFVRTMLKLGKKLDQLSIVNDQIGRLTFADDLADAIIHILEGKPEWGVYHMSNSGKPASWAEIARTIFEFADMSVDVSETSTAEFSKDKSPFATRPQFSTLNLDKIRATGYSPPDWRESLEEYIKKEQSA